MRLFLLLCTLIVFSEAALNRNLVPLSTVTYSAGLFSRKFYQTISEKEVGNLIASPISAHVVLSMAALGAGGDTKRQMFQVLNFQAEESLIKTGYQSLIDILNNVTSVEVKVANKIFSSKSIIVKPAFKAMTKENFRSESEQVDFSNPITAASTINSWCAEQTNNKIEELIEPDSLGTGTDMILVNAVYFKGRWKKKFNPSETYERNFHISKTSSKKVPTMYQSAYIMYGELPELNAKFVEIPYVVNKVSMIIVLPDNSDDLGEVEKKLENLSLSQLRARGSKTNVVLYLPKFRIESTINLNEILPEMGMSEMFSDGADFSGISENPLKVSKVVQKAFIQVDEEGSKAAAATGVDDMCVSMFGTCHFDVSRPFMYFIIHANECNTEIVLFHGKVIDPTM